MELQKIHHVAIIVSDYEVSKSFYLDVLGLKQIDENFRAERNSWKLDVALPDGGQLEIFTFPGAPGRPSQPEAQGLRHLCFQVADVDAAKQELERKGVTVEPIRVDPYTQKRFTFFQDPDGQPLELYEA